MECFIVGKEDIDVASGNLILQGDEARHAVRVLRISEGEHILATDLAGTCYKALCKKSGQLSKAEWLCECIIEEVLPEYNEPKLDLELIQGIPLQQSKLEEILERTIEIGISQFSPIFTKRTEKKTINTPRLQKIAENACKQTYRSRIPKLNDVRNLSGALEKASSEKRKLIILHESAPVENSLSKGITSGSIDKISILIGPEGGFDESEVLLAQNQYGAEVASLGPRRLRAETAAIMAVSIVMSYENLLKN